MVKERNPNPYPPKQIREALIELPVDTITYMYQTLVYKSCNGYYVGIREIRLETASVKSLDAAVAFIYATCYQPR